MPVFKPAISANHQGRPALVVSRRRLWGTIAAATALMAFAQINFGLAFISPEGEPGDFRPRFAAILLAMVPFVFMICAFGTQRIDAPRRVLIAMGVFLVVGLSVGLLDPLHGAATGFATGGALTLRQPAVEHSGRWRAWFVFAYAIYGLTVALVAAPAGVLVSLTLPLIFVGVADELSVWWAAR